MKYSRSQISRAANKAMNAIDPSKPGADRFGRFNYYRSPGAPTISPTSSLADLLKWLRWYMRGGDPTWDTDQDSVEGAWEDIASYLTGDGDYPLDIDPRLRGREVMHKRHVAKKKTASASRPGAAKRLVRGRLV